MVVNRKVDTEMSNLIDRQMAIDAVKDAIISAEQPYAEDALRKLPSVESEQKKGEWIYDGKRGRFPACKCSICGHYENADWAILQGVNFCPHCGADMRGEDGNATD